MKIKLATLKKLIREAAGEKNFSFEVYGPNDETYTVTATYNPRTPFDVEIGGIAVDDLGNQVDTADLEAQGLELKAQAMDWVSQNMVDDEDPPGTGWDDVV